MAIRIQPAMATLYGRAAQITGESQKAIRQAEEARQDTRQMQAIQLQQAREERSYQRQLETEERSHQWEIQKMEMRSMADFTEEETARQRKRATFQTTMKRIDELQADGKLTDETAEGLRTKNILQFQGLSVSDSILFPHLRRGKAENPYLAGIEAGIEAKMGGKAVPTEAELRTRRGPEAHRRGIELGYWKE